MPVIPKDISLLNFNTNENFYLGVSLVSLGVNEGGSGDRDKDTGFIKTSSNGVRNKYLNSNVE